MKNTPIILLAAFIIVYISAQAQCTINTGNTTPGITASNPNDTLTQGAVYGQTFQVYIPATYQGNVVDSVHLTVGGEPQGLTVIYLPADGGGETIAGGSNGVICFAGSTFDVVGVYPLTFTGTVYLGSNTVQLASLSANFSYTFYVKSPPPQGFACDTVINVSPGYDDTTIVPLDTPEEGYLSGNGAIYYSGTYYPFIAIGEKLIGGIGDSVTGALVQFGHVAINSGDSAKLIGVYVYDNNGPLATGALTGGPGAALDSAFLSLKTIANDVGNHAFSTVAFTGRAQLAAPDFFIVVKLPQTTGDTVVIFTNNAGTTNGAGYLEITAWYPYSLAAGLVGDSLGNFIGATLCGSEPNAPSPGFDVVPAKLCLGTTAVFNNVTLGNPTGYSWNFGDGSSTSSLMNPSHTYADTGTYLVTLTASNAGGTLTNGSYLKILANPTAISYGGIASSFTAADGAIGVQVTSGAPPYTFVWSNGASGSDTLIGLRTGAYIVTVTDSNTCALVDTIDVGVADGINTLSANARLKIYPNPANDVLFIQCADAIITKVELLNALGQTVLFSEGNSDLYQLRTNALAPGNYLLFAHTTNGIVKSLITIVRK